MSERFANLLATSTSPYLQQHAHNPVDWFPWGEEALAKARSEDKPIFLSIGYSACHWCHVMERESFEEEGIAEILNASFVPIKVDREERPDLDEIYMDAVQAIAGRGGWPMSVWLLPNLKPFYGGTYFPPDARSGMPGFRQLLQRISELWTTRRDDLERDAAALMEHLARQTQGSKASSLPSVEVFETALQHLRADFDSRWGGFGAAPKFPAHMAVELILRRGSEADRAMAERTLDAMWEGGLYDHLGGGFARYSVDGQWLVPHFEKMLYDNAQLACAYLAAFQAMGKPLYARIAGETLEYLLREMRDPEGGFYSSEDADSEGEEGKYFVFSTAEVEGILGAEDGALFCEAFGVSNPGNFERGRSVLHRFMATADLAEARGLSLGALEIRLEALRMQMLAARNHRVRPGKDDKVLAAWNGLMLSALARGHQVLGDVRFLEAAEACAEFIQRALWKDGTLLRVYRSGEARVSGFLEDYGAVARGLVDLYEAGFDARWLYLAEEMGVSMRARFEDEAEGGFFFTESQREDLLFRRKGGWDGALPSGTTLAVSALLRLPRHLDRQDFRASAERALAANREGMVRAPRALLAMLSGLDDLLREPIELVVAGSLLDPRTRELLAEARKSYLPGMLFSLVEADPSLPLHRDRALVNGSPAAYLCRSRSCFPPESSPEALKLRLSENC